MRWTDVPIHFIDFEGGASSGILEFGVVTLRAGQISETRTRLCRAVGRIRAEDSAVHHLTAHDVEAQAPFADEFDYFARLRESGPLAAHFAGTENGLIKSVWPYPRTSPDFARPGGRLADWGPWLDSGRIYAELYPKTESLQLESLVGVLGLQAELDALAVAHCPATRRFFHAALYDALAGALLLTSFLRRPELAGATIPWLLQMSTADAQKRSGLQQDTLFD
ncbi:MAG: 3'-5' exonuclease [Verrucomicrobia bacterium]|nr:3'-5' exonuclease [Verrucomicrobiota bacterium]